MLSLVCRESWRAERQSCLASGISSVGLEEITGRKDSYELAQRIQRLATIGGYILFLHVEL